VIWVVVQEVISECPITYFSLIWPGRLGNVRLAALNLEGISELDLEAREPETGILEILEKHLNSRASHFYGMSPSIDN